MPTPTPVPPDLSSAASHTPDGPTPPPGATRLGWRTTDLVRAALVACGIWFGLQLLWQVSALVFLVFLATLFGVAVSRGVDVLERYRVRRGIASALIVFGALGAITGGLALSAPTLLDQGQELQREFPAAVEKLQTWVDAKPRTGPIGALIRTVTRAPVASVPDSVRGSVTRGAVPLDSSATARPSDAIRARLDALSAQASRYLFSFVSSTVAVVGAFVMLVFLVMYIAAEPRVYRGWLLALVPASARPQARVMCEEIATVLQKWLVTQLLAMLAIGGVTTVMLLLLGVKAPFALGFIAGLLEFIPTVGPILSAIPGVLMGFVDSPEKALAVGVAYWGIQFLENNLLIPFLMRGEMDLPPAITLIAQTLMTLVFGFLGLMVAVPLTAAMLVPVRMFAARENAREHAREQRHPITPATRVPAADGIIAAADRGPFTE